MKRLINRLNKIYDQATIAQRRQGHTWYENAHREAVLLSNEFNVPLLKVVGVIAALSPNNKWERNLIDARALLAKPSLETKVCTFTNQKQKALEILETAECMYSVGEILNGVKTRSFYSNILFFPFSRAVTVDLWMYRAAKLEPSHANYQLIESAVQSASLEKKLVPHQYQAVVWSVIRG